MRDSGAPGIYFQDYLQLQGYDLPEWSQISLESAKRCTAALHRIIEAGRLRPDASRW